MLTKNITSWNSKDIKVSIISCTRNNGQYLENHIKSVQSQTHRNFEHIILDDASTDNSLEILQRLYVKETTIPIIRQTRVFSVVNHITGFKVCSGDIVVLLDGDDYFYDNNVLSYLVERYKDTNCLATYGSWVHNPNSKQTFRMGKHPTSLAEDVRSFNTPWAFTHLRTFRRELISVIPMMDVFDVTGEPYKYASDVVLLTGIYEYALKMKRVLYIDTPMVIYNSDTGSNDYIVAGSEQALTVQKVKSSPYRVLNIL